MAAGALLGKDLGVPVRIVGVIQPCVAGGGESTAATESKSNLP